MVLDKSQHESLISSTIDVAPITSSKSRYSSYAMFDKNRVIPRVIDRFQKATPKKLPENYNNASKKTSIQTLYRNTRSVNTNIGKKVAKHKMMEELLQNMDENNTTCESLASPMTLNNELTYRNIADKSCNKKEFYSTERLLNLNQSLIPLTNSIITNVPNSDIRVDKSTSITGLKKNNQSVINKGKDGTKNSELTVVPKRKNISNNNYYNLYNKTKTKLAVEKKTKESFTSSSFIEECPTRDVPKRPLPEASGKGIVLKSTDKRYLRPNNHQVLPEKLEKSSEDDVITNVMPKRSKEKSFVKIQVDKFNKISTPGVYGRKATTQNTNQNKKCVQGSKKDLNKNKSNNNNNYIHLMNAVRKSVPKIDKSRMVDASTDYNHDWSDCNTEVMINSVKFPKETKYAMEQRLKERRIPVQLSKFTTKYSENFRPAITVDSNNYMSNENINYPRQQSPNRSNKHFGSNKIGTELFEEKRQQRNISRLPKSAYNTGHHELQCPNPRRASAIPRENKFYDSRPTREFGRNTREVRNLHEVQKTFSGIPLRKKNTTFIPCSKNLLCDRGDHNGPCNIVPQMQNKCV